MTLAYLDFDTSEDTAGHGSFDAMASVLPARLPALQAEIVQVLAWAHDAFGTPGPIEEAAADWDYALQGTVETDEEAPLVVGYDVGRRVLSLQPGLPAGEPRITLTLTLVGTPAFCQAFRQAFSVEA